MTSGKLLILTVRGLQISPPEGWLLSMPLSIVRLFKRIPLACLACFITFLLKVADWARDLLAYIFLFWSSTWLIVTPLLEPFLKFKSKLLRI